MIIRRLTTLQGALQLPPDRLQAGTALLLAALAEGKSTISPWPDFGDYRRLIQWLEAAEISFSYADQLLEVEGRGLRSPSSISLPLPITSSAGVNLFWTTWATADLGGSIRLKGRSAWLKRLQRDLSSITELETTVSQDELHVKRIALPHSSYGKSAEKRNYHLLLALLHRLPFHWKAHWVSDDPLTPLLQEFGVPIELNEIQELNQQQNEGLEQLQELLHALEEEAAEANAKRSALERRIMRLSRKRPESFAEWKFNPVERFTGGEISLLADPLIAGFCAVLATLLPQSNLILEQVCVTPTRAGIFSALGRLGAEQKRSRERKVSGESAATLRVQHNGELSGRKFSAETVQSIGEALPLLAVATSFAEEESLFRGLSLRKGTPIALLADNLRKAGVEVGEFEDGLVLRGREELDGAEFTSEGELSIALANAALALLSHGESSLDDEGVAILEELWPGWHSTLKELVYEV